jgi:hypothetical protein
MDERPHPSPWIAAVARREALLVMAEHERTHHVEHPGGLTLETCSHCGAIAGAGAHGHTDSDWRWLRVEYVPAGQLDALREAVRAYLNGAPLDEHGRFRDPARETLYRAAGGR